MSYLSRNLKGTLNLLVAIPETSELLLSRCVPHIELDGAQISEEFQRMYFHTQGRFTDKDRETKRFRLESSKSTVKQFELYTETKRL